MRRPESFEFLILAVAVIASALMLQAQTAAPPKATTAPGKSAASKLADLSGDWGAPLYFRLAKGEIAPIPPGFDANAAPTAGGQGQKAPAKVDETPYQPWARAKMLSQVSPTGTDTNFVDSTDPNLKYCEPIGVMRAYLWPTKTKLVQTPEAVFILYEYGVTFRMVRLNSKHPEDPDPQWWGDSIGWYENGDTLVVDTIGFNDKTWLDQAARPHTDQLHLIERYKRVDRSTLEVDQTVDDPGAYTKPWNVKVNLKLTEPGFLKYQWACSTRENEGFTETLGKPATPPK